MYGRWNAPAPNRPVASGGDFSVFGDRRLCQTLEILEDLLA